MKKAPHSSRNSSLLLRGFHRPPTAIIFPKKHLQSQIRLPRQTLKAPQSDDRSYGPTTARSSSATRASLSHSSRTPSSALNTSTASVNSRPTTPANRSRTPAAAAAAAGPRPSTPRSATPARSRPAAAAPAAERPKSRPSTPTTRPHLPASSSRPSSQPSTPARRPPPPPPVSTSRPSSPARSRTPVQPVLPPALDSPPSLRAKLPERPVSAGRQRRATELTARGNSSGEASGSGVSSSRRPSSPAAARGRVAENQAKGRANGHRDGLKMAENQKPVAAPERKPAKPAQGGETGGYGRTLSKNSLNMAIKHMELRQGTNGMRGVSLFPHSIRSAPASVKTPPASRTAPPPPSHKSRATNHPSHCITEPTPKSYNEGSSESEELQRYDSAHLKQDAGALNWLRGVDESHLFDRRFDPFPEPFILM